MADVFGYTAAASGGNAGVGNASSIIVSGHITLNGENVANGIAVKFKYTSGGEVGSAAPYGSFS